MAPKKTISCPACESRVAAERIDVSALSTEARMAMTRDDRRAKYRETAAVVDEMRRRKAARREGREVR